MGMNILEEIDTEKEKRLPIAFTPPLTSYLPYSVVSAIITAKERNLNWVYNNFIQLYHNGFGKVDYYPNSDFTYFDKLVLNTVELNQLNYRYKKDTVLNDVKFWIDNKNYVIFYLAESHVPGMRFYGQTDKEVVHSQFVFGYNEEKQCVYVMNFPQGGDKLAIIELKYSGLEAALEYTIQYNRQRMGNSNVTMKDMGKDYRIVLLRYNESRKKAYNFEINMSHIRGQMEEFIHCENSSVNNMYFTNLQEGYWGVDVYNRIYMDFMDMVQRGDLLDFRFLFMLYEHKCLMKGRMQFLEERYAVKAPNDEMDEIVKFTEKFKNLIMKYNVKRSKTALDRLEPMFKELRSREIEVYGKYISSLKEF